MDRRLELHEILVGILGSRNVYYQPPATVKMTYPCIIYERDNTFVAHANNGDYHHKKRYQVTYVDRSPISGVPDQLERLPYSSFSSSFAADNLNHTIFSLYF
jgi:hypothetical protein